MKKNRYSVILVACFTIIFFLLSLSCLFPSFVQAKNPQPWRDLPGGDRCVGQNNPDVATIQGIECLFINLVRVATPVVGLLLFIMLIIGSLKYLVSGGDPKKVQSARQALTWAIAGVVIFFGIWFILQLIKLITGVDVTRFEIPG